MTEETKKPHKALKIILPILILVIGFGGFKLLNKMKPSPQRQPISQTGVLVDVAEIQSGPHQVRIYGTGTVQPARQISLVPEVNGKVIWIAPQLVNGGFFKQGETLLKIEAADYRLAVERAQAEIAHAKVALATEEERARVSMQEWQRVELPNKGEPGPLITREIQKKQEQANLSAAFASLKQAKLNLQRTELKAPFNGRIRQKQVDLGQYLRAGNVISNFAGTDQAEIHIPLPLEELRWLQIPAVNEDRPGSLAMVYLPGDSSTNWQGKVLRSLGEIDPSSRMATLIVGIDDPYQLETNSAFADLSNGLFVEIQLLGDKLENCIRIPRRTLRSDNHVWLVNAENKLEIRPVEILRREKQQLIIKHGIEAGELLVLTGISGAIDGMLLRPMLQEQHP